MDRFKLSVILITFLSFAVFHLSSDSDSVMNGAEIKVALDKLQVLGSMLYIAAHPDDENTAMLAWFSKERKVRTAYLSITRGGGGQNLIGSEKGPLMSVLRTYELLSARKIDGAEQFFFFFVDFGYSKSAEESMRIWGEKEILADAVYIIRKFKPDIIISRFPPSGGGHGHHKASAILAVKAFKAAGDASQFPEQLTQVAPWQAKRLFWNTWRPNRDQKTSASQSLLAIDVGAYNSVLGKSYGEIAAQSRTMHKSQGFGSVPRRGKRLDYLTLLAGNKAEIEPFEGIDLSWNRVPDSENLQKYLLKANRVFDITNPAKVIPFLIQALEQIRKLPQSYWLQQKEKELISLILSCAGLWAQANASRSEVSPDMEIGLRVEVLNPSSFPVRVMGLKLPGKGEMIHLNEPLINNMLFVKECKFKVQKKNFSHPYWLEETPGEGRFLPSDQIFNGQAVAPLDFQIKLILKVSDQQIELGIPIKRRWRDPVQGEKTKDLILVPPLLVNFADTVFYFTPNGSRTISLTLKCGEKPCIGRLVFAHPQSWKVDPAVIPFEFDKPNAIRNINLKVYPPQADDSCSLKARIMIGDKSYDRSQKVISYSHISSQVLHPRAEIKLVKSSIIHTDQRIGYIMGSGDDIPKFLRQIGYQVELLNDSDLAQNKLDSFDVIITGVRAFNTRSILKNVHPLLMKYVFGGGRLVLQYNVSRRLPVQSLGPFPMQISRKRVTEENAEISFINPDHPLLIYPNKIRKSDFYGWVQERGLYFADKWDAKYQTVLAAADKGENLLPGGLLFCKYGKGSFIYTGFSFFRQLPAGVAGALRLFVNLIESGE